MNERTYPPVILLARTVFRLLGLRFTIEGAQNIPASGGAVLASNHVSYLDFLFVGLAARPVGRLVRFMAKSEVFDHRLSGPLMRGMHHIPVDRSAGASSYAAALRALRSGELVGVFPEATISRSFEIKELKNGASRMAAAAGVPLVPVVVWGGQRLLTKGRPRNFGQRGIPVVIAVGEPLHPQRRDDPDAATEALAVALRGLLAQVQRDYPDRPATTADGWWQPAALGGRAPTPAEAAELDRVER